jgi:hypothetical protein
MSSSFVYIVVCLVVQIVNLKHVQVMQLVQLLLLNTHASTPLMDVLLAHLIQRLPELSLPQVFPPHFFFFLHQKSCVVSHHCSRSIFFCSFDVLIVLCLYVVVLTHQYLQSPNARTMLNLFKLIFSALPKYSENQGVLRHYLAELVLTCMRWCGEATHPFQVSLSLSLSLSLHFIRFI